MKMVKIQECLKEKEDYIMELEHRWEKLKKHIKEGVHYYTDWESCWIPESILGEMEELEKE